MMFLIRAGADLPRLQAHLGLPAQIEASEPADLPLHPALQSIMIRARDLAVLHADEGTLSTDHVLLALLTEDEVLRKELESFGFDHERFTVRYQGLDQRLTEANADVLDGVMRIDVEVAAGLDVEVEQGVLGQQRQHVVEKADAGG